MIADVPELINTLNKLRLSEVAAEKAPPGTFLVCGPRKRIRSNGQFESDENCLILQSREKTPVSIARLVEAVGRGMANGGHSHCDAKSRHTNSLASKLLAIAVCSQYRFEALKEIKKNINSCNVSLWAATRLPLPFSEQYRFGDFIYSRFDFQRFQGLALHAGCDYGKRISPTLSSCAAVERTPRVINCLDHNAFPEEYWPKDWSTETTQRILDDYYGELAEAQKEDFLFDLDQQQALFIGLGLGAISAGFFQGLAGFGEWITVFDRDLPGRGWGIPNKVVPGFQILSPHKLEEGKRALISQLNLEDWGEHPLDQILQAFCEYLQTAREFEDNGRLEEALLHHVFGLDLILGGESSVPLKNTLATRIAILANTPMKSDFQEVVAFIGDTYDLRSSYVHRGEKGKLDQAKPKMSIADRLKRLSEISKIVLAAGIHSRKQKWCIGSDARNKWVAQIDLAVATRNAGKELSQNDIDQLGLDRISLQSGDLVPNIRISWKT